MKAIQSNILSQADVRIIDFAKVQEEDKYGKMYGDPDAGFLLGLRSLIKILESLLAEKSEEWR